MGRRHHVHSAGAGAFEGDSVTWRAHGSVFAADRGLGLWPNSMGNALALGALRRAIQRRQPAPGLIHHTDRGGQFAWQRYRDVLRRARAFVKA